MKQTIQTKIEQTLSDLSVAGVTAQQFMDALVANKASVHETDKQYGVEVEELSGLKRYRVAGTQTVFLCRIDVPSFGKVCWAESQNKDGTRERFGFTIEKAELVGGP